jgi:alpha/beta superfamily hydrolase
MNEEAILFGKYGSFAGIMTEPEEANKNTKRTAIILLNSGLVHRVGPNRIYVRIARELASMGFIALRFDFSGIGDSKARYDTIPFEKSSLIETQEAMTYLQKAKAVDDFILVGNCSGAVASFNTAIIDQRVKGIILINPSGRLYYSNHITPFIRLRALARHYFRIFFRSSFKSKNWLKTISGEGDYSRLKNVAKDLTFSNIIGNNRYQSKKDSIFVSELQTLIKRGIQLLIIHCEGDLGLDFLNMVNNGDMHDLKSSGALRINIIKGSNHTFTMLWSHQRLLIEIKQWLKQNILEKHYSCASSHTQV